MGIELWKSVLDELPEKNQIVSAYSDIWGFPISCYWSYELSEFCSAETDEIIINANHWTELPSKPMGV